MKKKPSISRTFLLSMFLVTIISIGLLGCLWTWQQSMTFRRESKSLQEMMLNSYRNLLKTHVHRSVDYIEHRKSLTEQQLRISIQERIHEAHSLAAHLYEKWKGIKSSQEIQALIRESLRPTRFNQGRGYIFILDLQGINQLRGDRPELEGKDMLAVQGSQEAHVAQELISLARRQGEGFYRYDWSKPGTLQGAFPKIAFVRLFEPYGWIIGTGEYLDEFEAKIKEDVLNYLGTIRFGRDGYIFITQWDGLDLTGPAKGRNMLEVTDVNGVRIVRELITLAKSGGGFLEYVMPKFPGKKPDPKLSYVEGIKDWQWYVGAGIYIDDIETALAAQRAETTKEIVNSLMQIVVVLIGLMLFAFFSARRTARNTSASFDLFTAFFDRAARKSAVIDPGEMRYGEFENLAHSANHMIETRKHAQVALQESEKKYRLIVENINDLIIKLDQEKKTIFASPTYCNMFGLSEDETLNQPFLGLVRAEDREAAEGSLADLDRPPHTSYHEERVLTRNGLRWIAWSSRAVLNADGRPEQYVLVGRDITEKRQAEAALRENQAWLQSILDSIQAGVVVIDPKNHVVLELNRAAAVMIGIEKERLVNTVCHDHICPAEIGMCPVTDLGLSMEQSDRELVRVDGTKIPILKTVNRATISGEEYLIESFLDMSEKIRLESMLSKAQKMEAIGNLAGGIAHDFNNILFPIIGLSEMLLEDLPPDSPEHENAQEILAAGKRGGELVKQILTFSRQSEHQMIPVRIQQVLREVLRLSRSTIPSNIEIRQDIQNDCGRVMADPTQLYQIAMNLITNAYHAVELKGGQISVLLKEVSSENDDLADSVVDPGPYAMLSVADTGCGIDPAFIDKIFEPYFTTKEKGKGTGLGLAVVYGIVKKYGGDIKVYSELEKGTTFNVFIPLIEKDNDTIELTKMEKLEGGTERILLVDDEGSIVKLLKDGLERLGYHVTGRTSSVEALEAFRANPDAFDLVVTDMNMPNMTGDLLARELLSIKPRLPVIICTGFSERMNKEKAKATGIKGFLMKPVVRSELSKMIRTALERKDE